MKVSNVNSKNVLELNWRVYLPPAGSTIIGIVCSVVVLYNGLLLVPESGVAICCIGKLG